MPEFEYRSGVEVTPDIVLEWHERPGAFERLVPPWENVRVVERTGTGTQVGDRVLLATRFGPVHKTWSARISEYEPQVGFTDVQESGPFAEWEHRHRFIPEAKKFCLMEDHVRFRMPYGPLGTLLNAWGRKRIARMFYFRHDRTRYDITRLRLLKRKLGPVRVVVTGSSGLIGTELVNYLRAGGYDVRRMVRRAVVAPDEIYWNPADSEIDAAALEGTDVVIHLAGENIASQLWTAEFKETVRLSRFQSTHLLAHALAGLKHKPATLISASAIGYYGSRPGEELTEDAAPGQGFLAETCKSWEKETAIAAEAGIRVVNARIGVVISARGGALAKALPVFRKGLGGKIGSGAQVMSWVSLEDVIGAISYMMCTPELRGPVNVTAPHAIPNADFSRILGGVLRRPVPWTIPAWAIRRFMGERGETLGFQDALVVPKKLQETGFRFIHPELWGALCHELGVRTVMA